MLRKPQINPEGFADIFIRIHPQAIVILSYVREITACDNGAVQAQFRSSSQDESAADEATARGLEQMILPAPASAAD